MRIAFANNPLLYRIRMLGLSSGVHRLAKQGVSIAVCRVVGMGLAAVGSVWAARCLGPENLGISGMVNSVVQQAAVFGNMISTTVLIREYKVADQAERHRLVKAYFTLQVVLAIGLSLLAIPMIMGGVFPTAFAFAAWMFIPLVLLGAMQSANWLFQATERIDFQSFLAVVSPAATSVIYVVWFRPGMSAASDLIVASSVGAMMSVIYWVAIYRKTDFKGSPFSLAALHDSLALIKRSRWFYLVGIVTYAYTSLEMPLLGYLGSIEQVGLYRSAGTMVRAAQGFLTVVPVLLFPRFVEWRRQSEELLWKRQRILAVWFGTVAVLGSIAAFAILPWLHPRLFGHAFAAAAIPSAILVTSQMVILVNGIFGWGLWADRRNDRAMAVLMTVTALISVGLNLLFIPRFGTYAAAIVNLVSELLILALCYRLAARNAAARRPRRDHAV